jgi:hypothetical protein
MLPILLIPGLNCSARLYAHQIPLLWRFGPTMVANHTYGDTVEKIANQILRCAPPRFTLIGFFAGRLHRFRNSAAGARPCRSSGSN